MPHRMKLLHATLTWSDMWQTCASMVCMCPCGVHLCARVFLCVHVCALFVYHINCFDRCPEYLIDKMVSGSTAVVGWEHLDSESRAATANPSRKADWMWVNPSLTNLFKFQNEPREVEFLWKNDLIHIICKHSYMSCDVMPCHVMICCDMLWHVMLCHFTHLQKWRQLCTNTKWELELPSAFRSQKTCKKLSLLECTVVSQNQSFARSQRLQRWLQMPALRRNLF